MKIQWKCFPWWGEYYQRMQYLLHVWRHEKALREHFRPKPLPKWQTKNVLHVSFRYVQECAGKINNPVSKMTYFRRQCQISYRGNQSIEFFRIYSTVCSKRELFWDFHFYSSFTLGCHKVIWGIFNRNIGLQGVANRIARHKKLVIPFLSAPCWRQVSLTTVIYSILDVQ